MATPKTPKRTIFAPSLACFRRWQVCVALTGSETPVVGAGLDDSLLQGLELTSRMTETAPVPLGIRTAMFPKCPRVPPPAAAAQVRYPHHLHHSGPFSTIPLASLTTSLPVSRC